MTEHAGTSCEHIGGAECPRLAYAVSGGDDLREQLDAALRIIARDNGIDVMQARQLVNQEVRR